MKDGSCSNTTICKFYRQLQLLELSVQCNLSKQNFLGPTAFVFGIKDVLGLGLWCLTPLLTIFQLYHGGKMFIGLWCLTPLLTIFQLYHGGKMFWFRFNATFNNISVISWW